MNNQQSNDKKHVLLLGVAFYDRNQSENPTRGQGFRDRIRCESLENIGYVVRTLDDKHKSTISSQNKHCQTNFADARRMRSSMDALWTKDDKSYDHIILDYFFSPAGWARTRWTDNFYRETLPLLASDGYISMHGKVWLPNLKCVKDCLDEFKEELGNYFVQSTITMSQLDRHPLYVATERVEDELLRCPDKLNNKNQIQPIYENSEEIFICLTYDPVTAGLRAECNSDKEKKTKPGIKRRRLNEQDFSQ